MAPRRWALEEWKRLYNLPVFYESPVLHTLIGFVFVVGVFWYLNAPGLSKLLLNCGAYNWLDPLLREQLILDGIAQAESYSRAVCLVTGFLISNMGCSKLITAAVVLYTSGWGLIISGMSVLQSGTCLNIGLILVYGCGLVLIVVVMTSFSQVWSSVSTGTNVTMFAYAMADASMNVPVYMKDCSDPLFILKVWYGVGGPTMAIACWIWSPRADSFSSVKFVQQLRDGIISEDEFSLAMSNSLGIPAKRPDGTTVGKLSTHLESASSKGDEKGVPSNSTEECVWLGNCGIILFMTGWIIHHTANKQMRSLYLGPILDWLSKGDAEWANTVFRYFNLLSVFSVIFSVIYGRLCVRFGSVNCFSALCLNTAVLECIMLLIYNIEPGSMKNVLMAYTAVNHQIADCLLQGALNLYLNERIGDGPVAVVFSDLQVGGIVASIILPAYVKQTVQSRGARGCLEMAIVFELCAASIIQLSRFVQPFGLNGRPPVSNVKKVKNNE